MALQSREERGEKVLLREVDIEEISDGCFYGPDDMVPVGCADCAGCSDCCRNTGDSIILDPFDFYRLSFGYGRSFEDMIEREIEIRLADGLILPNLMQHDESGEREDGCPFLNEEGRCSIHPWRPGLCRLFPLGRFYEDGNFRYFIQKDECTRPGPRSRVRVSDWICSPAPDKYDRFINDWHDFVRETGERVLRLSSLHQERVANLILHIFYVNAYDYSRAERLSRPQIQRGDRGADLFRDRQLEHFLPQFRERLARVKAALAAAGL